MKEEKSNLSETARAVLALMNEISDMERKLTKKKFELVDLAEGNISPDEDLAF